MDRFASLFLWLVFLGFMIILLVFQPRTRLATVRMKMRMAIQAPWGLSEFLHLKPSRWKLNQYYSFSEETVRSLGYRFIGRFDKAILHWENVPVLDMVVEHKFPVRHLPDKSRPEDMFQTGLYALALFERGVSCSTTCLVNIYCLQDRAKWCLEGNNVRECWKCRESRIHVKKFQPKEIIRSLRKMDEFWYRGQRPVPTPTLEKCRACPYSNDKCNYSAS